MRDYSQNKGEIWTGTWDELKDEGRKKREKEKGRRRKGGGRGRKNALSRTHYLK